MCLVDGEREQKMRPTQTVMYSVADNDTARARALVAYRCHFDFRPSFFARCESSFSTRKRFPSIGHLLFAANPFSAQPFCISYRDFRSFRIHCPRFGRPPAIDSTRKASIRIKQKCSPRRCRKHRNCHRRADKKKKGINRRSRSSVARSSQR